MTIEARWDDRLQRFRYKLPQAGFVTPAIKRTSVLSPNDTLIREVKELAFAVGVKLPAEWELMVIR